MTLHDAPGPSVQRYGRPPLFLPLLLVVCVVVIIVVVVVVLLLLLWLFVASIFFMPWVLALSWCFIGHMLCGRHCLQQCVHGEEVELYEGDLKKSDDLTAECTAVEHWHAHAVASLAIRSSMNDICAIFTPSRSQNHLLV